MVVIIRTHCHQVDQLVPDQMLTRSALSNSCCCLHRGRAIVRQVVLGILPFEVTEENGVSKIRQTAIFDPVGLFGILYWYSLFPLHELVFRGMLRNICKAATKNSTVKNA